MATLFVWSLVLGTSSAVGASTDKGLELRETTNGGPYSGEGNIIEEVLARADLAYAQRGRNANRSGRAAPAVIQEAILGYEAALADSPEDVSIRWRLLRSLHFAGDFSVEPLDVRRAYLDRGREVAGVGLEQVGTLHGSGGPLEDFDRKQILQRVPEAQRRNVGVLYFWTALIWGSWAQTAGTFDAVREGVANRLYDYSEVVLALTPSYYTGGIHRLRSHMHATLPKIPLLSGWVDRDRAVPEARAALEIAPLERGNHTVYAMALLETREGREEEALEILREVVTLDPREESRVEDLAVRGLAQRRIAQEEGDDRVPDSAVGSGK